MLLLLMLLMHLLQQLLVHQVTDTRICRYFPQAPFYFALNRWRQIKAQCYSYSPIVNNEKCAKSKRINCARCNSCALLFFTLMMFFLLCLSRQTSQLWPKAFLFLKKMSPAAKRYNKRTEMPNCCCCQPKGEK